MEERRLDSAISAWVLPRRFGAWNSVVVGPKGGSGKTPTAASVAQICAMGRGEITALLSADPHMTTLRRRLVADGIPGLPWLDLAGAIRRGNVSPEWSSLAPYLEELDNLRLFTNAAATPARVERLSAADYTTVVEFVSRAAEMVFCDMGTSTTGDLAVAALDSADQLIVCTKLQRDVLELTVEYVSALAGDPRSYEADATDYSSIADGRYRDLLARAIIVVGPGGGDVADLSGLLRWLDVVTSYGKVRDQHGHRPGRLVVVPFDPHIDAGQVIDPYLLRTDTRLAYKRIASELTYNFQFGRLAWSRTDGKPPGNRNPPPRRNAPRLDEPDLTRPALAPPAKLHQIRGLKGTSA